MHGLKLVKERSVPSGCSYSFSSKRALFNAAPAGASAPSKRLVCINLVPRLAHPCLTGPEQALKPVVAPKPLELPASGPYCTLSSAGNKKPALMLHLSHGAGTYLCHLAQRIQGVRTFTGIWNCNMRCAPRTERPAKPQAL